MNALHQSELEDFATIELSDDFIAKNLDRPFNADYARSTLNETTDQFIKAFLVDQADNVARLHASLKECQSVLVGMEEVLEQFISQLGSIQQDIGQMQEILAETVVQLTNTRATEKVLWAAVSCLVVPPEVVQVVTQSNAEQLGTQFMLCVKELLKYLNYRKGTWRQTLAAVQRSERADTASPSAVATPTSTERSTGGLRAGSLGRADTPAVAREVRFSLAECKIYYDTMSILDALTLFACVKIKTFLSKKLSILRMKNTNMCIQQDHVLRQFSFYVHFLRSAVPLLRHVYSSSAPEATPQRSDAETGGSVEHSPRASASPQPPPVASNTNTTLLPYRIVRALFEEFKREYCVVVSHIYLEKIQEYAFVCNALEFSTESTAAGPNSSRGGGFLGMGGGGAAAAAASGLAPSGISGGGSASSPTYGYTIPLVTDMQGGGAFVAMRLGERVGVLSNAFAPPLIPTMEKAASRKHTYEETFRSIISLTCDIVTHEYLFTFDFFAGDMTVYVDVLKPTVQFIVDYLSEVVLVNSSGAVRRMLNERPHTSVNARAKQDTYGLLILIRLCQEYRSMMKHTRRLSCLDGFFDSLLMLLWPAFNTCYERQLNALMTAKNSKAMIDCMAHLRRTDEKLCFTHPLVKSFAEFSCAVTSVAYGVFVSEELRIARSAAQAEEFRRGGVPARGANTNSAGLSRPSSAASSTRREPTSPSSPLGDSSAAAWAEALRVSAVQKIGVEHESDAAESGSHFLTLVGDIAFMRIELVHLVEQIGTRIVASEPNADLQRRLQPVSGAFALNNLCYLLQVTCQCPLVVVPSSNADANSGQTDAADESQALPLVTLEERDDLNGLKDTYSRLRTIFVENVIRAHLGGFLRVIQEEDQCDAATVLRTADNFALNWKVALDGIRETIQSLLSDRVNAQETTAQACMDLLLYNTRFHAVVAKFLESAGKVDPGGAPNVFQGRTLRSLIITNQLLLQHMRTFSVPLNTTV